MANLIGLVGRTVAEVERDLILETLRHCLGNRTRAAPRSDLSPSSFRIDDSGSARSGRPDDKLHVKSGIHVHEPCLWIPGPSLCSSPE